MDSFMWWVLGVITGILTLMTIQVVIARRDKHYMQYDIPTTKPSETKNVSDWDMQELALGKITPRAVPPQSEPALPPAMQECPECGKAYKRVSQHMRLSHKTRLSEDK